MFAPGKFWIPCLLALAVCACVTTQPATVTSRHAPVAGLASPSIIVVAAPNLPIDERVAAEEAMAIALGERKLRAIRSTEIFPPERDHTAEQVRTGLIKAGAQALLVFNGRPAERNITVAGGRYLPSDTYKSEQAFGPGVVQITRFQPGTGDRPYSYDVLLFHSQTPQPIWQAEAVIRGGNGISFRDLAAGAARDSVSRLIADKAI